MARNRITEARMNEAESNGDGNGHAETEETKAAKPCSRQPEEFELAMLEKTTKTYHKTMIEHGVRVDLQFLNNSKGTPCVKKAGYETFGVAKLNHWKDRAMGCADARLMIDDLTWGKATKPQQVAMLDDLLESIEVVTDENGELLRDDAGRPKLKRRKDDIHITGFQRVVREHETAAPEVKGYRECNDAFSQLKLFDVAVM